MAIVRSYWAACLPGMEDRNESRMAHAPSTASSNPGRRHTELLLIQPLLNSVSPSAEDIPVDEYMFGWTTQSNGNIPSCPGACK